MLAVIFITYRRRNFVFLPLYAAISFASCILISSHMAKVRNGTWSRCQEKGGAASNNMQSTDGQAKKTHRPINQPTNPPTDWRQHLLGCSGDTLEAKVTSRCGGSDESATPLTGSGSAGGDGRTPLPVSVVVATVDLWLGEGNCCLERLDAGGSALCSSSSSLSVTTLIVPSLDNSDDVWLMTDARFASSRRNCSTAFSRPTDVDEVAVNVDVVVGTASGLVTGLSDVWRRTRRTSTCCCCWAAGCGAAGAAVGDVVADVCGCLLTSLLTAEVRRPCRSRSSWRSSSPGNAAAVPPSMSMSTDGRPDPPPVSTDVDASRVRTSARRTSSKVLPTDVPAFHIPPRSLTLHWSDYTCLHALAHRVRNVNQKTERAGANLLISAVVGNSVRHARHQLNYSKHKYPTENNLNEWFFGAGHRV